MSWQGPPPGPGTPPGGPPPGFSGYPGAPPGYAGGPPGYPGYDPQAPYGRNPQGEPYSDKSRLTAGLLELFLGHFGVGRFYLGDNGIGLAQLLTCGGCYVWALVDAIMMLSGSVRDKYGRPLRD